MHLATYLGLLHRAETALSESFRQVVDAHGDEPDVRLDCVRMARQCERHVERLAPFLDRYGEAPDDQPERLHADLFQGTRTGGLALLRDLHDLYVMTAASDIAWTVIGQAAQGARDSDLHDVVTSCERDTVIQQAWIRTRMKAEAPQALVVV
jgi:hypothetical protein